MHIAMKTILLATGGKMPLKIESREIGRRLRRPQNYGLNELP